MEEGNPQKVAGGGPLASFRSWVYDPAVSARARGFWTATVLVFPGVVEVRPRNLPRALGRAPAAQYDWPAIVVERLVWSYRARWGTTTILLDFNGQLGSAWVPFGMRKTVKPALRAAGFDVVEVVVRGWETPHPLRRRDHPELQGRVPQAVLVDRTWWPDNPRLNRRDADT